MPKVTQPERQSWHTTRKSDHPVCTMFPGLWDRLTGTGGGDTWQKGCEGFPGGAVVKDPPDNAGDKGSIPGPGRSHMPRSN